MLHRITMARCGGAHFNTSIQEAEVGNLVCVEFQDSKDYIGQWFSTCDPFGDHLGPFGNIYIVIHKQL